MLHHPINWGMPDSFFIEVGWSSRFFKKKEKKREEVV